ncbi:hypothetical protein LINPERHAP1_LOCUS1761 [Linum perenne]
MEERLHQLAILEDEEEVIVPDLLDDAPEESFELCAVGTFVTDKTINFVAMKTQLANLWKPVRGVTIEDKGEGLYLFRFFHEIDLRLVVERGGGGGGWMFDGYLLTMHVMKPGEELHAVLLFEAEFWVQIHGLSAYFYSEVVGSALGNYLGQLIEYDTYNHYS